MARAGERRTSKHKILMVFMVSDELEQIYSCTAEPTVMATVR